MSRPIVKLTCFKAHEDLKVHCDKTNCKHWMKNKAHFNCTLIAAKEGPMTLQEIGEAFGVTRMRICQIEKTVLKKLSDEASDLAS